MYAARLTAFTAILAFFAMPSSLPAQNGDDGDTRADIIDGLERNLPSLDVEPSQLTPSAISGLWTLQIGPEIVYVDEQGEHLFQGDVINLSGRENLTENARQSARSEALAGIPADRQIIYPAEDEAHRITVFTDIDCGYCRQLHRDMADLNEAGISVHYLFFPRGGQASDAWDKSNAVWCADDRRAALDRAKSGRSVNSNECEDTPTETHYNLGRRMGVTGTPAIITDDGRMIRGYMPLPRLVQELRSDGDDTPRQENPRQGSPR